jgi:hypothetical protein
MPCTPVHFCHTKRHLTRKKVTLHTALETEKDGSGEFGGNIYRLQNPKIPQKI